MNKALEGPLNGVRPSSHLVNNTYVRHVRHQVNENNNDPRQPTTSESEQNSGWLEFSVSLQHTYGSIRGEEQNREHARLLLTCPTTANHSQKVSGDKARVSVRRWRAGLWFSDTSL